MDELAGLDAVGQAELVRRRTVSPLELVDAAIARIERYNPVLNAVIAPLFDEARSAARSPALPAGPFGGVPFLLKDLGAQQEGQPYWCGNRARRDIGHRSRADTALGARFRAAGLITLGKTNLPEFGPQPTTQPLAFGDTHNPWDLRRSPGGSSGGSCAAVAAGLVPIAHANDGGGSIRLPAAWCGLVGLKPSRGRTAPPPRWVVRNNVEHVVARSVRDVALDAVHGNEPGDLYTLPPPARPYAAEVGADPGRLRIGLLTRAPFGDTPRACVDAAESAARLLTSLGHIVEPDWPAALFDADVPRQTGALWSVMTAKDVLELAALLGRPVTADDVEPYTWATAERARRYSGADYLLATEVQQDYARRVASWWSSGDQLLLTPTAGEPPPTLDELRPDPAEPLRIGRRFGRIAAFTMPWNVTGQPAISLPLHWTAEGLPVGVQLVGAMGREDVLIRVAAQLERAAPWAARRPRVWSGASR
jgi:amidase